MPQLVTQSKENADRPCAEAAVDLDLWLPRTSDMEQLTIQVRTRWLLPDIQRIVNGTSTMADIIFDNRRGRHFPSPNHGAPQPVAVCGHTPYGTHGGLYPGKPGQMTLVLAPQGSPPHPGGPDPAPHLGGLGPPSPRASRPKQGNRTPAPRVPDVPGTPETGGAHQPLAKPARTASRRGCPIESPAEPPPAVCPPTARRRQSAQTENGDRTTVPQEAGTTPGDQGSDRPRHAKSHTALRGAAGDLP